MVGSTGAARRNSHRLVAAALLIAACAFLVRLIAYAGFTNDHFVHLSRAQAMLHGDLPLRDYTEEGVPLTVAISAGAQRVLGEGPFAELILVLTSLAIAAGVTCYASGRLTGSILLGVFAGVLQLVAAPRFYSHPKILLYPLLFLIGPSSQMKRIQRFNTLRSRGVPPSSRGIPSRRRKAYR